jgi:predicted transcriptional regulator
MELKNANLNFKVEPSFKRRLGAVAQALDRPVTRIVKEALNDKFKVLAATNPTVAEALANVERSPLPAASDVSVA